MHGKKAGRDERCRCRERCFSQRRFRDTLGYDGADFKFAASLEESGSMCGAVMTFASIG